MNEIIKLNNVTYAYREGKNVLSDINFTIYEGEDISIIGHNGSGKSTLGKLILGLLFPKQGTLEFNHNVIDEKNINLLREKSGLVFQNPDNQFVGITVEDDIAFGLENRNVERYKMQSIIEEYAKKTGVLSLLKKSPENLSGGQKQRVAIAGILAMSPDVIVFDEALSMLDPKGKEEINNLINKIKIENPKLTIIRITHDLDETVKSDRIIVLNKGFIKCIDTPNNIYKNKELIKELNLEIPFIYQLNDALLKEGVIKEENYDISSLVDLICK